MRDILERHPDGSITYFEHDEMTGKTYLYTEHDPTELLRFTQASANESATDGGIKKGFWHYAELPMIVLMQLREKGIDPFDPSNTKRLLETIERDYPYLKMTQKTHITNR